jgi:hypothetical protein
MLELYTHPGRLVLLIGSLDQPYDEVYLISNAPI